MIGELVFEFGVYGYVVCVWFVEVYGYVEVLGCFYCDVGVE